MVWLLDPSDHEDYHKRNWNGVNSSINLIFEGVFDQLLLQDSILLKLRNRFHVFHFESYT